MKGETREELHDDKTMFPQLHQLSPSSPIMHDATSWGWFIREWSDVGESDGRGGDHSWDEQ